MAKAIASLYLAAEAQKVRITLRIVAVGQIQAPADLRRRREAGLSRGGLAKPLLKTPEPEARPAGWLPMNEKHEDNLDRVWDIIEKVGVTMLTTQFSGGLRARPLEARPERDAGLIWFVTDVRSGKEHEIEAEHDVCLVFIDAGTKAYLSITARAEVRHDHAKAAEIWKSTDNMWWSGPDDPNVCVLRVRPVTAELWDGPAYAAVAAFEFAKARITGAKPNLGENRKVTVKM